MEMVWSLGSAYMIGREGMRHAQRVLTARQTSPQQSADSHSLKKKRKKRKEEKKRKDKHFSLACFTWED